MSTDSLTIPESLLLATQNYGSALGEMIRTRSQEHRRELMMAHSLSSGIENSSRQLFQLGDWIEACWKLHLPVREKLDRKLVQNHNILKVLESYSHQLYVDYLGELHEMFKELKRVSADKKGFSEGWTRLDKILRTLEESEAKRYVQLGLGTLMGPSGELAVLEYSHMKKFFQSTTFVEVTRRESGKRLAEPTAAIGAAAAALFATTIERASAGSGATQGLAVVALGIALYAVRDRLKDRFREITMRSLKKIIADVDVVLKSQKVVIGKAKEWFSSLKSTQLQEPVKSLRLAACLSEPEKFLNEDVLHFKKQIQLLKDENTMAERSYLETLRVNFERHLKYLDEPVKSFRQMDFEGKIKLVQSHRVYHIHLVVEGRTEIQGVVSSFQRVYRLVLDKTGLQRVEQISV